MSSGLVEARTGPTGGGHSLVRLSWQKNMYILMHIPAQKQEGMTLTPVTQTRKRDRERRWQALPPPVTPKYTGGRRHCHTLAETLDPLLTCGVEMCGAAGDRLPGLDYTVTQGWPRR